MYLLLGSATLLGPIGVAAALVLLIGGPGKWRKRLGVAFLTMAAPALLLFLGNWLLDKLDLAWRNSLAWGFALAAWAGLAAVLVCAALCLGEKLGRHRIWKLILGVVALCVSLSALYWCALFASLSFGSERVIQHEGARVVEVDRSFLDPQFSYYAYHGPLVRGSEQLHSAIGEGPWQRWEDETE